MADKSTRALMGIRVLHKQFEMGGFQYVSAPPANSTWVPDVNPNVGSYANWKSLVGLPVVYNEQYLDLSGYELDDLTLVPVDVKVQDPGVYLGSDEAMVYCVYDLLSNERLTEADIRTLGENNRINRQMGPGMPEGPLDREQVVFGMYRFFAHNTTQAGLPSLMLNARTMRFGSGEPSAVQKLWAYRIVICIDEPAAVSTMTIPAATFCLTANIVQESDIPYLMRLKRSYELATGN